MLGLSLRKEFQGRRLKGTAIELANRNSTGATQISAAEFLDITYPSGDVLEAIEGIGPEQGRPLVLIGERGQGKSHLMAVLYHALTDAPATKAWLGEWEGPGDRKTDVFPFKGPRAKRDRQRLLLHRLFENRMNVPAQDIQATISTHVDEYIRLFGVSPDEHDKTRREFIEITKPGSSEGLR